MQQKTFQPLRFLAAMATGGLASAPYLLKLSADLQGSLATAALTVSAFFIVVHFALTGGFFVQGFSWLTGNGLTTFRKDWTRSPQILMPLGSLAMSINVFVGPLRELLPGIDQWSFIWQPILTIFWGALAMLALIWIADILSGLYSESIEITKLGFVWLFPSLTLGLMAVSGSFLASTVTLSWEAHVTGLGSAIMALFGFFLIGIMLPTIVRNQFRAPGLPALGGAYSMLNMVPTVTLYGIAFAHWSGYAQQWFHWSMQVFSGLAVLAAWSFATGYAIFGVRLLFKTIKADILKKQYVGNQWALSCVPIAWSVLTSLLQENLFPSGVMTVMASSAIVITLPVFVLLVFRMARCVGWLPNASGSVSCA